MKQAQKSLSTAAREQSIVSASGPQLLDLHFLGQVVGGSPKGTWASPKGTWGSPKGTWDGGAGSPKGTWGGEGSSPKGTW